MNLYNQGDLVKTRENGDISSGGVCLLQSSDLGEVAVAPQSGIKFLNLASEFGLKKLINTVQLTERENVRELLKLNTSVGGHRSIKDIYRKVIHANGNETAKNCSLQEEKEGRK